jgi:hypothetical protein
MLHIAVDHDASEIRLVNGQLDVRNEDGILSTTRLRGQEVQLMLPPPPPPAKPDTGPRPDILQAVDDVTRKLIVQVGQSATDTQKRIGSSFTSYLVMIAVLFAVGVVSFAACLVRGAGASGSAEVVVTAVYGGLSATAFVSVFLTRPMHAMSKAGPHAAWVQSIVNTYWMKMAYLNDPEKIVGELDDAQKKFDSAMSLYLRTTSDVETGRESGSPTVSPSASPSASPTGSPSGSQSNGTNGLPSSTPDLTPAVRQEIRG